MMDNFWFDNKKIINELNEENKLLNYLIQFQDGDFSSKEEFVNYFLNTLDWNTYVFGTRLYMAICSYSDLEMVIPFLSQCDEKQLQVFLVFMPESLTVQFVPLLLALYEDWKNADLGQDITRCICEILGHEYHNEIQYDINELGNLFISFSEENDLSLYYYRGQPYFVGDMTKSIISMAVYCRSKSIKFLSNQMPSILSNGTGIECPVHYGTVINDSVIHQLYEYVNQVVLKQQLRGNKYFYNHLIDD